MSAEETKEAPTLPGPIVNWEMFTAALELHRRVNKLSYAAAGKQIGVDYRTLHRMQRGYRPKVETFIRMVHWLRSAYSLDDFIIYPEEPKTDDTI